MKKQLILPLVTLSVFLTSCGNNFSFNGVKYRTNSRSETTLGSLGHKNGGFLGLLPESYKAWGQFPIEGIPAKVASTEEIKTVSKKEIMASLKEENVPAAEIEAKAEYIYSNVKSGRYRLVTFLQEDFIPVAEDKSTPRAERRYSQLSTKKARVVTAVILAFGHSSKTERIFEANGTVKVSSVGDGSLKFRSEKGETITLEDDAIIAYELSYPQYRGDTISRFKVDRIGWDSRN